MIYLRAFLNENLGDDLFVQTIAERYQKSEFEIFTSKKYPVKFGDNVHFIFSEDEYNELVNEMRLYEELRKNKVRRKFLPVFFRPDHKKERAIAKHAEVNIYVIGSGFMEGGTRGWWQKLEEWLYYKNKPYLLGCNFGPFVSEKYKKQYEKLFAKASDICFRESYSYNIFKGLNNIRWESDIVFSYNGYIDESYYCNKKKYVVISVVNLDKDGANNSNKVTYYKFIYEIAEYFLKQEIRVVFVGFCKNQGDDVAIENVIHKISPKMLEKIDVINYPQKTISYILGVFKHAEAVFASRYHAGIIGLMYERKTYFLSYSNKTVNVLKDIDDKIKYIDINDKINIDINEFIFQYAYCISPDRLRKIKESANRQFLKLDSVLK